MEKKTQIHLWYLVVAVLAVLLLHDVWEQTRQIEPIAYSEFQRLLREGKVEEISVRKDLIQGRLKQPLPDGRRRFVTARVDTQLARDLAEYGVKFTGVIEGTWLREIVAKAFEHSAALLTRNRALLEEGARRLLEKETMGEADLAALEAQLV